MDVMDKNLGSILTFGSKHTITSNLINKNHFALNFNGINQYATLPVYYDIERDYSFQAKIAFKETTSMSSTIFLTQDFGESCGYHGYRVYVNNRNEFGFLIGSCPTATHGDCPDVRQSYGTDRNIDIKEEFFATFTCNQSGSSPIIKLYKNADFSTNLTLESGTGDDVPTYIPGVGLNAIIGTDTGGTTVFSKMQIREIRIWDKCLTADEIKNNWDIQINPNTPNLKAYFPCNEGQGNILHDKVAGNNATLQNNVNDNMWVISDF